MRLSVILCLKQSLIVLVAFIVSVLTSCIGKDYDKSKDEKTIIESGLNNNIVKNYSPPQIPTLLKTVDERVDFLATHYWQNFNFCDTTILSNRGYVEQAWSNYLAIIQQLPYPKVCNMLKGTMQLASIDSKALDIFYDVSEKYLYNANSPMRNEDYFIPILEFIIASEKVDELMKLRPIQMLNMAKKNRVGSKATDFDYTTSDGTTKNLHSVKGDYIIIFFNNPDCEDCKRVKDYITKSELFKKMINKQNDEKNGSSRLTILSVYPDEDVDLWRSTQYPNILINSYDKGCIINTKQLYDLKAIPTLYLLNSNKEIILKDDTVENIEKWLNHLHLTENSKNEGDINRRICKTPFANFP